ncbi:hypothetical protein L9F63_027736, partial [Diploptera punctata]
PDPGKGNVNRRPGSLFSSNPITEMELKGRRKTDQEDNDDPPFNFQAMLRKTNTNRASLKRAHEKRQDTPIQETYEQHHDKNITTNERCDSRSSSIVYNSSAGFRSPTPSIGSKKSWTGNEQWNKPQTKKAWNNNDTNDNDEWNKAYSTMSWNDNEHWNKSDSKKSWNDEEESNESTPWNESTDFCRSLPSELSRSSSTKSWNKQIQIDSNQQSPDLSNEIMTTELVPGLILEGQ